jgi:hypothetical protein
LLAVLPKLTVRSFLSFHFDCGVLCDSDRGGVSGGFGGLEGEKSYRKIGFDSRGLMAYLIPAVGTCPAKVTVATVHVGTRLEMKLIWSFRIFREGKSAEENPKH